MIHTETLCNPNDSTTTTVDPFEIGQVPTPGSFNGDDLISYGPSGDLFLNTSTALEYPLVDSSEGQASEESPKDTAGYQLRSTTAHYTGKELENNELSNRCNDMLIKLAEDYKKLVDVMEIAGECKKVYLNLSVEVRFEKRPDEVVKEKADRLEEEINKNKRKLEAMVNKLDDTGKSLVPCNNKGSAKRKKEFHLNLDNCNPKDTMPKTPVMDQYTNYVNIV
jgi:hypothetical protein